MKLTTEEIKRILEVYEFFEGEYGLGFGYAEDKLEQDRIIIEKLRREIPGEMAS